LLLALSVLLLSVSAAPGLAQVHQDQFWDAAQAGDTVTLSRALAAGAQIDGLDTRRSPNGRRASNWAAIGNHVDAIRFLVAHGANVNAANLTGFTPLHHAAENGQAEAAKVLLELGADRRVQNGVGETAADVARRTSHPEVVAVLETVTNRAD
jgi:ankyrin repeat protein